MKKRKVAMMLFTEPQRGGEHRYAMLMAECIKELPDLIYEVIAIIVGNHFWSSWCEERQIKYIILDWPYRRNCIVACNLYCSFFSKLYNKYATELGKVIRREQIDVLIFTSQLNYIPNIDSKIITPVHDLMHRYESEFPEVKGSYKWRELLFKCQAKYADYILTDSELGAKQFEDSYLKRGKRRPHIISLPYTVTGNILEIQEEYIRVPDKYVFYPAQFWKHKNHINLIKAIQILKNSIQDIHIILIGSDKGVQSEIKKYILDYRLEKYVTILDFVSDGNIVYLYKHALGMIMPSYFGPTNIPPLEAMALGCPVAVSNKYAMPEQTGDAGLMFNPDSPEEIAECIKKLWTKGDLREEMKKKGYIRIGKWTKTDFKNKVHEIIEECLIQ